MAYASRNDPETLLVDASDAYRGLMRVHLAMPVRRGTFTMVYPKWIPGEHEPSGPLPDVAQLRIRSSEGTPLTWHRDQVDMYAIHIDVPARVSHIDVDFRLILDAVQSSSGSDEYDVMSSSRLAILNWNRALFYQDGTASKDDFFFASIILPSGWDYGTALPVKARSGRRIAFSIVPLNELVDSPLDIGRYARHIALWRGEGTQHVLDLFADRPEDLNVAPNVMRAYQRLTSQAFALYGSRHWKVYHSLLALSDAITPEGIEHHQSNDCRAAADFLTDSNEQLASGDLVAHEFSHSWNGKYRRPFDLWQPNFQSAEHTELLWVYEGLNQYLGDLLSFRSGIRDPSQYPEFLASIYASMDTESGRATTPLIELTTGAPFYYDAEGPWSRLRRTADDFYTEGELVWLDADSLIRSLSRGRKSLDDFLHAFTLPARTGPITKTYTREDVEHLLNTVQPYDWHGFFERYVYEVTPHPPTDELARSGWRLVYDDKPNAFIEAADANDHNEDETYGVGLKVSDKGEISDVREGSAAWNAGLGPGMKIEAVDGRTFSSDEFRSAIREAQTSNEPIALTLSQDGWVVQRTLAYHGGLRYPHLVRIPDAPDMLARIMAPRAR